ncbi:hypothetical protein [Zavarzinella formosa]|uniref:hypothetical protein n=1 Tax=Zavarzinella formosa TaxID=360055 RepID=UPI0002D9B546|nr:hypothetical protein [Zavarzinella formosa]
MAKQTSIRRSALRLEPLEGREVPAAMTGVLSGTTLTIEGTESSDTIVARVQSGQVSFSGVTIRDGRRFTDTIPLKSLQSLVVRAQGGNDVVNVSALNIPTQIWGGNGNDQITGGSNRDTIYGDPGNDTIRGNAGNDWLVGGEGNDVIYGGVGDDWITGDPGNDHLYGEAGNDRISGGDGRDTLSGGAGTDQLDGSGFGTGLSNSAANFDVYQDDFSTAAAISNSDTAQPQPVKKGDFNQTGMLAVFSALSATDIRNSIKSLGGRQYQVTLKGDNKTVKVEFDGTWTDNDPSPIATSTAEFWPILLFRARLQSFGINPTQYYTDAQWTKMNTDSKGKLFDPADALRQFTGRTVSTKSGSQLDFATVQLLLSQKHAGVAVAYSGPVNQVNSTGITAGISYSIRQVIVDPTGRKWIQLYNPQGVDTQTGKRVDNNPYMPKGNDGLITLSWDDFRKTTNFSKVVFA